METPSNFIKFDVSKLAALRESYFDAQAKKLQIFTFEGHEYDINYAKYLIEFLEARLGGHGLVGGARG